MEISGHGQELVDEKPYVTFKCSDGFEMRFSEEEVGGDYWKEFLSALESGERTTVLEYLHTDIGDRQSCGALVFKALHLQLFDEREQALGIYDKALLSNQKDARAWLGRGSLLCDMGDYTAALEDVTEALKLDRHSAYAHCVRGDVQRHLAHQCSETYRTDRARRLSLAAGQSYQQALALSPESVSVLLKLGSFLSSQGRWRQREAVGAFEKALALEPDNIPALLGRGSAYFQLGEFANALIDFEHVLSLDPDRATEWISHGSCLYNLNRLENALESYERSTSIDSEMPLAWLEHGLTLAGLGRHEEAVKSFDRAVSQQPRGIPTLVSSAAMEGRGRSLEELGKHREARQSLKQARSTRRMAKQLLNSKDRTYLLISGCMIGVGMLLAAPILWATVVRAGQFSATLPIVLVALGSLLTPPCALGLRRLLRRLADLSSQATPSKD
jgi:tetratricopeptide (TPR) repeat protein